MKTQLRIRARRTEGALLRVLGLVVRRGFDVLSLAARVTEDGGSLNLSLLVAGQRPAEVLARQVERLVDVDEIEWTAIEKERTDEPKHRRFRYHPA